MRCDSILAATLAIATAASAQVERPRFYFPRHIKRVTSNGAPATPAAHNHARADGVNLLDGFSLNKGGSNIMSELLNPKGTGALPPIVVQPTPAKTSPTTKASAKSSQSSAITFGPDGVVTTPSTTAPASKTTTDSNDLVGDLWSGLFGPGSDSSTTASATATTTSDTSSATTSASKDSSSSATSTTGGPLDLPPLTLPPLIPTRTSTASDATNTTSTSTGGWLSSLLDPPILITKTTSLSSSSTGLGGIISSIIEGTGTTTAPPVLPTTTNGTSISVTSTSTNITIPADPTGSTVPPVPTGIPSNGTISATTNPVPSTTGTVVLPPANNSTATITKPTGLPTLTVTNSPTTVSATTTATTPPPQTIMPTGTNSASSWLPGAIVVASSATDGAASPSATSTGVPPTIPKVISPPNGSSKGPPADSTLVQIGFLFPLNYQFVVANPVSSAQIFQWLPEGLADGLGLRLEQIVMQSLIPLDTTARLGYITTLAMAYIPSSMFNTLALDLHIPTSAIYNNPSTSVNTLMNFIDPSIPLTPGSNVPGGTTANESTPPTTAPNSGVFNNAGQQKQSSSSIKSTAGIATGVVGAAAAYGAAMFFIARRYKKRRQSHRRSASSFAGPEMMQSGNPALMGGANAFMSGGRTTPGEMGYDRNSRGSGSSGSNSARTQQISGPMMAENSLGWN